MVNAFLGVAPLNQTEDVQDLGEDLGRNTSHVFAVENMSDLESPITQLNKSFSEESGKENCRKMSVERHGVVRARRRHSPSLSITSGCN